MTSRRRGALLGLLLVLVVAAPACGGSASGQQVTKGQVTVFAASSLTGTFETLGRRFEQARPGTTVRFSFGSSAALAQQIRQGAPAEVFAAASPATMQEVTAAGEAVGQPAVFARNRLQIAVPKGNHAGVDGIGDLADASLTIALCAPQAPCGAAAVKALAAAGVAAAPDTLEADARATLAKVRLGEVDAALVYRTDVLAAADEVDGIDFPQAAAAVNDYPIVVLKPGGDSAAAKAFVDYVRSATGKSVLVAAGFELP